MLRFATWKIVAILSMTALALLIIVPSLLPPGARAALIDHMPGFIPVRTIVLGLDLQGGSHVLLEVDSNEVIKTEVQNLRDDARRLLREEKIPITGGIGLLPRGIQVHVNPDRARQDYAETAAAGDPDRKPAVARPISAAARHQRHGQRHDPGSRHRRGDQRPRSARRRPVDRGSAPPRRCVGHHRAQHPTPGQRSHPCRSAGLAEPRKAEGNPRHHGEARIPPRRQSGRGPRRITRCSIRPISPANCPSKSR